ncbi:MAG: NfeD family protein [Cyanobacteria bacterium P01_E01_bin.34]
MTTVYWFCTIVGGFFVFLASISGLDGVEFGDLELGDLEVGDIDFGDIELGELEFEGDVAEGVDMDVEVRDRTRPGDSEESPFRRPRPKPWLPFTSLRFWTFGTCFFGLTGLLLSLLAPSLASSLRALLAISFGLISGTAFTYVLHLLRRSPSNSMVRPTDLIGKVGVVEVPLQVNSPGKIRLNLGNSSVAFLACTDEETELEPDDTVVVIRIKDNRLWVVPEAAFQSKPST